MLTAYCLLLEISLQLRSDDKDEKCDVIRRNIMEKPIRVLIVEDVEDDAMLVVEQLKRPKVLEQVVGKRL